MFAAITFVAIFVLYLYSMLYVWDRFSASRKVESSSGKDLARFIIHQNTPKPEKIQIVDGVFFLGCVLFPLLLSLCFGYEAALPMLPVSLFSGGFVVSAAMKHEALAEELARTKIKLEEETEKNKMLTDRLNDLRR